MRAQASWRHALAAVAGIAVWLAAAPARAVEILDDPAHIEELATAVQQTSNSLCWEMYRYHQSEPDFKETYRAAKDLWSQAGALRDALRAGAVESADAAERVARMGETFTVIDRNAAKWRDGVRPADPMAERRGVVVRQGTGVAVDIPFIGVRVGRPDVIVEEDAQPQMERRRYHPNARGSKRALERELAGVKTALSYLTEDTGVVSGPAPSPNAAPPTPQPPDETRTGPALRPPQKITPSGARKSTPEPARS